MPNIQQSLTEPNTGADHTRLNEFLAYLAEHLAAATAVIMLHGCFSPQVAARRNRQAA
jgi:hypothetical protein